MELYLGNHCSDVFKILVLRVYEIRRDFDLALGFSPLQCLRRQNRVRGKVVVEVWSDICTYC